MVADDVIALSVTIDEMKEIAEFCCKWAADNGLNWNPLKSKLLKMFSQAYETHTKIGPSQQGTHQGERTGHQEPTEAADSEDEITLDGKVISRSEEADYLGLVINTRRGFVCKPTTDLLNKGRGTILMISKERWFSLKLKPRHIANIYNTYVRSILLYGSELLTHEEREPLLKVDDELIRIFLKGLLKLNSTSMATKHTKRLHLILRLPTMSMEVEHRCWSRVETWLSRTNHENEKIALHAKQSIEDVQALQTNHPLRQALHRIVHGESVVNLKDKQWHNLEVESRGSNAVTSRGVKVNITTLKGIVHCFPRFLEDPKVDPALKRVMLRWSVYKFPVRYKATPEDTIVLTKIRNTNEMNDTDYKEFIEQVRRIFNKEQEEWGLWKLHHSYVEQGQ